MRNAPLLKDKLLLLAGPFEILPDGPDAGPNPQKMPAMVQALDSMGYAAGALNPDEAAFLLQAGAPKPANFTVLTGQPQTKLVTVGGHTVGNVFFPPSPDPTNPAPAAIGDAVATAARELRTKAGLVVGISGLGMSDEQAFLEAHPGVLDILLGSGPNAGISARPAADGKTLWSRAYIKGKTINRLDLLTLPGAADFTWKPDATYKAEVVYLDDQYPADPAVAKLFE